MNKKLLGTLVLAVGLVLVFVLWDSRKQAGTPQTSSPGETSDQIVRAVEPIAATADVDTAVDSFLLETAAESQEFELESAELNSVLGSDSAALQDLGEAYDPNEF